MKQSDINRITLTALFFMMAFFMLNGITMVLNFAGYSVTIPVMVLILLLAGYFSADYIPQKSLFYLLCFSAYFFYLAISLSSLYFFQQTHSSIDIPYLLRSVIYNLIIIYVFYRFVLNRLYLQKFNQVINVLFVAVLIGCFLTLYSGIFGLYTLETKSFIDDPTKIVEERLSGIYMNPNLAGFVANIGLILSLTILLGSGLFRKIIGFAGIVFSIATSVATFSKTSFLQCAIILFVFIVVFISMYRKVEKSTRRHIWIVFTIILFLITQLSVYFAATFDELKPDQQLRIEQLKQLVSSGKVNSDITTNRSDALSDGFSKISEHPFVGNGFCSFMRLKQASERVGEDLGVHNTFLLVLGDAGIFPFLLYVLFHVLCLLIFLKLKHVQLKFFAIMLLLSTSFFNTTNHDALINPLQALIVGILCGIATYAYWGEQKTLEYKSVQSAVEL